MSKLLWLVAGLNSAGALVLTLVRYQVPSADFWTSHGGWIVAAVVVTFGVPLTQAAVINRGERGRRKEVEQEQTIQAFLATSLIYLVEQGGTPWKNTGVQAFQVRGAPWRKRQDRLAKMRVGAIPTSGVNWSRGKGVIGRCWATRQPQYEDLAARYLPYEAFTELQWNELSDDERFGLTFDDFRALKGKYGIVAAVPIIKNDKYIGCISADMPPLCADETPPNRGAVLESLAMTARLVAHVIG